MNTHQYIERSTGKICTETLYADKIITLLYSSNMQEKLNFVFNMLTNKSMSYFLGYLNYDSILGQKITDSIAFLQKLQIDISECYDDVATLDTPRKIFERKIRYWIYRPMENNDGIVVSPSDARMLCGSLNQSSMMFIKEKFFSYDELLGIDKIDWLKAFQYGDFAIFRLTPDKYHYNHMPISGIVVDHYEIDGEYHSCNPTAVIRLITPYSKNKRVVTIVDTDCPGGDNVGLVAMIEVVAMMIGRIEQVYSEHEYDNPISIKVGMFLQKGCPKSLFRPGSSTVVVFFQKNKIKFEPDLIQNQHNLSVKSRFSLGLGKPLVETDVLVRSTIAKK